MIGSLRWYDHLALALVAAVTFYAVIFHGWVLDDHHFIRMNDAVTGGVRLALFDTVQTQGGQFYRPVAIAVFSAVYALAGELPAAFHLLGGIAHVVASVLVGALGARLAGRFAGLMAGALFAVHPVHVEAVASIANSTEVFATVFVVAALLAWVVLGDPSRGRGWNVVGLVAVYVLALLGPLCKESGIMVVVALFAVERTARFRGRWPLGTLAGLMAVATYLLLRRAAVEGLVVSSITDFLANEPLATRVTTVLWTISQYARLLVFPVRFAADYGQPTFGAISSVTPQVVLGGLVLLGVGVTAVVGLVRGNVVTVGAIILGGTMALYLHVIPLGPLMAERFLYLPSVGFCLAAGAAFAQLREKLDQSPLVGVLGGILVATAGFVAASRNLDWHSSVELWEAEIATHNGGSAFARANYGLALYWEDRKVDAIAPLESAMYDETVRIGYAMALGQVLAHVDEATRLATIERVKQRLGEADPRYVLLIDGLEGRATGVP
jgi:hypothetical protein